MNRQTKSLCYNYLIKLNRENLLYTRASNSVGFTDFSRRRTRMTAQKQKGLVRNCRFALAILKCHKKSGGPVLLKKILACFDFSETRIRQQIFSVCLIKNLVNFFANYRLVHSEK